MPWVGGELCLGAFQCGREAYAVELLRRYADHMRGTGGEPGFRTTNEVRYADWGLAQWDAALFEGIAGVRDLASAMRAVQVSPRWAAAGVRRARVCCAYGATGANLSYRYEEDAAARRIGLEFTGSGERADFHLLLPTGWDPVALRIGGAARSFRITKEDKSRYADFSTPIGGVSHAVLECRTG